MLNTEIYRSIYEIDKSKWNDHIEVKHFYHQYDFLSSLEDAKVENADFWYIVIKENDKWIGTVVLSAFIIHLDLMIGSHWLSRLVRASGTQLLKVKILFCGTPVSIGHKNFYFIDGYEKVGVEFVAKLMETIALQEKIKHIVFKELTVSEADYLHTTFIASGFFRGNSLPCISLANKWKEYDSYINELRSGYRRQIHLSIRKMGKEDAISIVHCNQFDASLFYKWYIKVMERATVKLEVLNEDFFKFFFTRMNNQAKLIVYYHNKSPLAAFVIVEDKSTLYFVWAGKPNGKELESDIYFNLMHYLIKYGIEKGVEMIELGQTAYYTKQRFGGGNKDLLLYYKASNKLVHLILNKLSPIIFPKIALKYFRVFK